VEVVEGTRARQVMRTSRREERGGKGRKEAAMELEWRRRRRVDSGEGGG
jgi:hypothetical protein